MHDLLVRKGWKYVGTMFGVRVYMKTGSISIDRQDVSYTSVGLTKDDHWTNYCCLHGSPVHLQERVQGFLLEISMSLDWRSGLEKE